MLILFPLEHMFRYKEEDLKTGEDYHSEFASAKVFRVRQGAIPDPWIFELYDAEGELYDLTDFLSATFDMKGLVSVDVGEGVYARPEVTVDLTQVDGEGNESRLQATWDEDSFAIANFYYGTITVIKDDGYGYESEVVIGPKVLRIEVIAV